MDRIKRIIRIFIAELPLLLLRGRKLPDWFNIWLKYIPTAIFGALIFPDIFLKNGALDFTLQNYGLWATICAFPIVYKTQSLPVALVAGTVFMVVAGDDPIKGIH